MALTESQEAWGEEGEESKAGEGGEEGEERVGGDGPDEDVEEAVAMMAVRNTV